MYSRSIQSIHTKQNFEGLRVKTECSIRILQVFQKRMPGWVGDCGGTRDR